jgi:hypothetical protein
MEWARRMDEGPNPGENEKPGARLDRFFPVRMKKTATDGLAGTMAGDALMFYTHGSSTINPATSRMTFGPILANMVSSLVCSLVLMIGSLICARELLSSCDILAPKVCVLANTFNDL